MTWDEFVASTPDNSIALDGVVSGGPNFCARTNHVNFDHHDNVVREATMSTAMQVYYAIKGGLMDCLFSNREEASIYVNDTDQDTVLAVWFLLNYKKFEGAQSYPHLNRLLALNDRWDITGGAFPMCLDDKLVKQHAWVFQPYTALRKSGGLASANEQIMLDNLIAVISRLNDLMMGQAGEVELDIRHEVFYDSPHFKIVHEIGGNEARYYLYNKGMKAFISLVACRPDGRFVYSVGRASRYVQFPVKKLYGDFNASEKLNSDGGWNGSDIIGGSSRKHGSGLSWEELRDITNNRLRLEGIIT